MAWSDPHRFYDAVREGAADTLVGTARYRVHHVPGLFLRIADPEPVLPTGWITWIDQTPEWLYLIGGLTLLAALRGRPRRCSYIAEEGVWLVQQSSLLRRTSLRKVRFSELAAVSIKADRRNLGKQPRIFVSGTWTSRDGRVLFMSDVCREMELPSALANTTIALATSEWPAKEGSVLVEMYARYADWMAKHVVDATPILDEAALQKLTSGAGSASAAIGHLFHSCRWADLLKVANVAKDRGVAVDALLPAWAHLELGDVKAAEALDDTRRRMAPVRARIALAHGDLSGAERQLTARDVDTLAQYMAPMRAVVQADLDAARGDREQARAHLEKLRADGYDLSTLAASAWPSAAEARLVLGIDGPYR